MSIRKYIAYLRTVETGSITRTAADLGYTQSAVSKMIADLEGEWQVQLLTRGRGGVELTSEGIALLPAIQAVVQAYNSLGFEVSNLHGVQTGLLRIGCFTSMSTSILPDILKTFHARWPNIRIEILNGEYQEIADWLWRGTVDCGFVAMPAPAAFEVTFLLRDAFVAIVPETHPLAQAAVYPIARLPEESYIKLNETPDHEIDLYLDALPAPPNVVYEVANDFALLSMVECGLGVSIVHDLILHPMRYRIARLPLDRSRHRDIGIAVRRGTEPSTVTRLFLEHIRSALADREPLAEH